MPFTAKQLVELAPDHVKKVAFKYSQEILSEKSKEQLRNDIFAPIEESSMMRVLGENNLPKSDQDVKVWRGAIVLLCKKDPEFAEAFRLAIVNQERFDFGILAFVNSFKSSTLIVLA